MEVVDRQQLGLALLEPVGARQSLALGAVPVAAGAVANMSVLAVVAPFDNTAESASPAVFDRLHQDKLMEGQIVRPPVSGAVESKDVGQFRCWPYHVQRL